MMQRTEPEPAGSRRTPQAAVSATTVGALLSQLASTHGADTPWRTTANFTDIGAGLLPHPAFDYATAAAGCVRLRDGDMMDSGCNIDNVPLSHVHANPDRFFTAEDVPHNYPRAINTQSASAGAEPILFYVYEKRIEPVANRSGGSRVQLYGPKAVTKNGAYSLVASDRHVQRTGATIEHDPDGFRIKYPDGDIVECGVRDGIPWLPGEVEWSTNTRSKTGVLTSEPNRRPARKIAGARHPITATTTQPTSSSTATDLDPT